MKKALLLGLIFLLPTFALAAGFAKDSLFLSKSPVQEGDSVRIYAIVANDGTAKFTGSVVLSDGSVKLGLVAVAMDAGGTQTASIVWKPAAGSHTITAALTGSDGSVVESESAAFSIAAKPAPAVVAAPTDNTGAAVESSASLQKDISNLSPQVGQASQPFFSVVDGLRSSAANVLDAQLANAKNNLTNNPNPGLVLGSSTGSALPNPAGSFWFILWTLYLYLLTIARWIVGNAGVFYPVLAVVFFYLLWKMYKRFRRPY